MSNPRFSFSSNGSEPRMLEFARDIRLSYGAIDALFSEPVNDRVIDLVRIAAAAYVVDRLCITSSELKRWRDVSIQVEVLEPDFWREHASKIQSILGFLSGGDNWKIDFIRFSGELKGAKSKLEYRQFKRICLYSGGLDSAAGLAGVVRERREPMLAVSVLHQPKQYERIRFQISSLSRHFSIPIELAAVRANLIRAPDWKMQESSQRCRAFLFGALGIAYAEATHADEVELYESGIGVVNLPLTTGMMLGCSTTKSCHPSFLRKMSELATVVSDRPLKFGLPWLDLTKGEVARFLREEGLKEVALSSVSCAHYPLHEKKSRVCGICPACIGRRQALAVAGISEPGDSYLYDFLDDKERANAIPREKTDFLRAILAQAYQCTTVSSFDIFNSHLHATNVLSEELTRESLVRIFERYGKEWLVLAQEARKRGIWWGVTLSEPSIEVAA